MPFSSVKYFRKFAYCDFGGGKKNLSFHETIQILGFQSNPERASSLTPPLLMAGTAGWDAENDAFHLCIQGSFLSPVTALILILLCGFQSFWNLDSCAFPWSVKLLSIGALLWVSPLGSRRLKLNRKEALSWSPQAWGPLPDGPCTHHTCHDGRIPPLCQPLHIDIAC